MIFLGPTRNFINKIKKPLKRLLLSILYGHGTKPFVPKIYHTGIDTKFLMT